MTGARRESMTFELTGDFRVYFNRHGAEPRMWCLASEDALWELAVVSVEMMNPCVTVFVKKETNDEDDEKPSAWISVHGTAFVYPSGQVVIRNVAA